MGHIVLTHEDFHFQLSLNHLDVEKEILENWANLTNSVCVSESFPSDHRSSVCVCQSILSPFLSRGVPQEVRLFFSHPPPQRLCGNETKALFKKLAWTLEHLPKKPEIMTKQDRNKRCSHKNVLTDIKVLLIVFFSNKQKFTEEVSSKPIQHRGVKTVPDIQMSE